MYKSGAKRISDDVYDVIRHIIYDQLNTIISSLVNYVNLKKKTIITGNDIINVMEFMGYNYVGSY